MKIAVVSGKGGSGKSSVTAALIALAPKVVAIDCDVDASNLPLLFAHEVCRQEPFASGQDLHIDAEACVGCGLCAERCAFHAIEMSDEGKAVANNLLCEGCALCAALCPQQAITLSEVSDSSIYTSRFEKGILMHGALCPGDDNSGKMIARIRKIADQQMKDEEIDTQILDGPPGIGCPVLSTVTGMDLIVIVSEPTLSGISDLQRAYRVASSFCQNIRVVINKCDVNSHNRDAIAAFCSEHQIPVIAELPFDRRLVEAQLNCESIITYAPESKAAQELKKAYQQIFG